MTSERMSRTPFFTFSPGEVRKSEFDQFFEQLARTLKKEQALVVIMSPLDDLVLNAPLLSTLGFNHVDFQSIDQGVLFYEDWTRAENDLWLLLSHQEPELIFNCTASFDSLMHLLREAYASGHDGSESASVSGTLLREFSPLLLNMLGKLSILTPTGPTGP